MRDDQLTFYQTVERDYWGSAWGNKPDEVAILDRYLSPDEETVEAGTGNGRILFQLAERGFGRLAGFDFVPELIDVARATEGAAEIEFEVADAKAPPYEDGRFGQAIYLSQVASLFERAEDRAAVVGEACRILRPGGRAIFSFLSYDARRSDWRYRPFLGILGAQRAVRRRDRSRQLLPLIRTNGRLSPRSLLDAGPHVYWYRTDEAERELLNAGFELEAIGSTPQVLADAMVPNAAALAGAELAGTLYAVVRRPFAG